MQTLARTVWSCLAALLLVAGCTEESTAPTMAPTDASLARGAGGARDDSTAQLLARGMALALRDSSLRATLRDVLRDSPNPYQSIHLQSFLAGTEGTPFAAAAAAPAAECAA